MKSLNLKVVKSQLYTRIIDNLHEFHSKNSIKEKVKKDIHICEILINKNIEKQVTPILRRIRSAIFEYELFEQLPDLLRIEQRIWTKNWYKNISESDIRVLYDKMTEGLERQKNLSLYQMYRCIVQKAHFDKIRLQKDIKFIPDEAFKSSTQAISLRAKIEYYKTLAIYYFMTGAVSMAYKCNQELLNIYEVNNKLIRLFPNDYIITLNNYSIDSLNLNKHEGYETGIKKMEDFLEKNTFKQPRSLKSKVFEMLYTLKFNVILNTQDYESGLELLEKFEPLYKIYESEIQLTPKVVFWYLIAYILYFNEKYKDALDWIRRITQEKSNTVEEIQLAAHIIELVLKYEIGHQYFDAQIINTRNRIRTKRKLYESERQMFSLLREVTNAPIFEKKEVFKKYLPLIEELRQNPKEARFYNYFDLLHWVQSKA